MSEGLQLVMSQGPNPGRAYAIDRASSTMGRDPSNEIAINDPQVSRLHARVFLRETVLVVEDMGSTNGTFVNGMRLTGPQTLTPGDVIGLGDAITLTYYSTGAVSTAAMGAPPPAPPEPVAGPPPRPAGPTAYPVRAAGVGRAPAPVPAPFPVVERPRYDPEPGWDDEVETDQDDERARRRKRVLIGCGCLALVLACLAVALGLWYAPAAFWEFLIRLGVPIPPSPF